MNPLRMFKIMKEEGFRTFQYCVLEKILDQINDKKRYQKFIQTVEPRLKDGAKLSKTVLVDVCRINMKPQNMLLYMEDVMKCNTSGKKIYMGFVSDEDILADGTLQKIAQFIENCNQRGDDTDLIYSDHDYLDEMGKRCSPCFKGEYSPDTLLSYNYIGGFWCAKIEYVYACMQALIENMPEIDIQLLSYALLMQLTIGKEVAVKHMNQILLHRTKKIDYTKEQLQELKDFKEILLKHQNMKAIIGKDSIDENEVQHIYYDTRNLPMVSIIIPSKDNPELLKQCIDSVKKYTPYTEYELIVIDNGSNQKNQIRYKEALNSQCVKTTYLYKKMDFNFSKMCNMGAKCAYGKILLFLNDDIEILRQDFNMYTHENSEMDVDWLGVLAGQAIQKRVGAVGAKLLYPNSNRIQHIGVVNYEYACLAHIYSRHEDNHTIKDYRNTADYNYLCVTGACIMIEASKFNQVGGFNEALEITHNDVDLCMKLYENGYNQVQRNDVKLLHHESFSRGEDVEDNEKELRNMRERELLYELHPDLEKYDPFYSPCLTQKEFECQINTEVYSIFYMCPKELTPKRLEKLSIQNNVEICAEITSVAYREDLQIRGFLYSQKEEQYIDPYIIFRNENKIYKVQTKSICDRVFHKRKGLKHHINFAPFFAGIKTTEMEKGSYQVDLYIESKHHSIYKSLNKNICIR